MFNVAQAGTPSPSVPPPRGGREAKPLMETVAPTAREKELKPLSLEGREGGS
jgi:hypothetical protein